MSARRASSIARPLPARGRGIERAEDHDVGLDRGAARRRSARPACRRRGRRSASRDRRAAARSRRGRACGARRTGRRAGRADRGRPPSPWPASSSRRSSRWLAKCSWPTVMSALSQRMPISTSVGSTTSRMAVSCPNAKPRRAAHRSASRRTPRRRGAAPRRGPRAGGRHDLHLALGQRERRRLGRSDAARHVRLHRADAALVGARVEPEATRRTLRRKQLVAALPSAQRRLRDTDDVRELLDPPAGALLAHRGQYPTRPTFDKH